MSLENAEMRAEFNQAAAIFDEYLGRVRVRKQVEKEYVQYSKNLGESSRVARKVAKNFVQFRHLEEGDYPGVLYDIYVRVQADEKNTLAEKNGEYNIWERIKLSFRAKSKFTNGLTEEERLAMYRDVGYTDDEIAGITGKKVLFSGISSVALNSAALGVKAGSVIFDDKVPFAEKLVTIHPTYAALTSLALYMASYGYVTVENLRLVKEKGTSLNVGLTGMYLLNNRLLPNKVRDFFAGAWPIASDTYWTLIASGVIQGIFQEPQKLVAAFIGSSMFNVVLGTGIETYIRKSEKATRENSEV